MKKSRILLLLLLLLLSFFTLAAQGEQKGEYAAHMEAGKRYARLGRIEESISEFDRALALKPDHSEARLWLGRLQKVASFQSLEKARIQELLTRRDLALQEILDLAQAYLQTEQWKKARDSYREILEFLKAHPDESLQPLVYSIHHNLGIIDTHLGDIENATAEYRKSVELNPGHDLGYAALGQLDAGAKDWEGAERNFQAAIRISPKTPRFHAELALLVYRPMGEIHLARRELDRALRLSRSLAATDEWGQALSELIREESKIVGREIVEIPVYENQALGIQSEIPFGWKVQVPSPVSKEGELLVFRIFKNPIDTLLSPYNPEISLILRPIPNSPKRKSSRELLDSYMIEESLWDPDLKRASGIERGRLRGGWFGSRGHRLLCETKALFHGRNFVVKKEVTCFVKRGRCFILTSAAEASDFDQLLPIWEKFLKGLKF